MAVDSRLCYFGQPVALGSSDARFSAWKTPRSGRLNSDPVKIPATTSARQAPPAQKLKCPTSHGRQNGTHPVAADRLPGPRLSTPWSTFGWLVGWTSLTPSCLRRGHGGAEIPRGPGGWGGGGGSDSTKHYAVTTRMILRSRWACSGVIHF